MDGPTRFRHGSPGRWRRSHRTDRRHADDRRRAQRCQPRCGDPQQLRLVLSRRLPPLVLAVVALCFAGCGSGTSSPPDASATTVSVPTASPASTQDEPLRPSAETDELGRDDQPSAAPGGHVCDRRDRRRLGPADVASGPLVPTALWGRFPCRRRCRCPSRPRRRRRACRHPTSSSHHPVGGCCCAPPACDRCHRWS